MLGSTMAAVESSFTWDHGADDLFSSVLKYSVHLTSLVGLSLSIETSAAVMEPTQASREGVAWLPVIQLVFSVA